VRREKRKESSRRSEVVKGLNSLSRSETRTNLFFSISFEPTRRKGEVCGGVEEERRRVPSDDWVVFKDIRHTLVNQQSPDQEERREKEGSSLTI
jgi:hypothetical protein